MRFAKYHALGNDYIVVEAAALADRLTPATIQRICDRHLGLGADGVLVRAALSVEGDATLRIFNADGSEAEQSGNGLRIFARYLWDRGAVGLLPFEVITPGGHVTCQVLDHGQSVVVEMGQVRFTSEDIPVAGPPREVLREELVIAGQVVEYSAATIGNPHCVILRERLSDAEVRMLGPLIETHAQFPQRINVQFLEVIDRQNLRMLIWERGVGYTLASGSSSCAAAAIAHRLGLCVETVTVHMPGGQLGVEIHHDYTVRLHGPVVKIAEGALEEEALL